MKTDCGWWKIRAHKWSKWIMSEAGSVLDPWDGHKIGTFEIQRRECLNCGKSQLRKART